MKTSKVTSKKQITLPDTVMDALNLKTSERVSFIIDDSTPAVVRIKKILSIDELAGYFKPKNKKKLDINKIDDIVGDAIVEDYLRGLKDE